MAFLPVPSGAILWKVCAVRPPLTKTWVTRGVKKAVPPVPLLRPREDPTSPGLLHPPRSAIAAGLHGYNGVLVGLLMAVFSDRGNYYWWLLLPVIIMSMSW